MDRIIEPDSIQLEFSRIYPKLVLASSSPNRKALIEKGGSMTEVFSPEIDEERIGRDEEEILLSIASRKLEAYLESESFNPHLPAIAADTLVLIDNKLLGKPKDLEDARAMLEFQSGKRQRVLTAVGLYLPNWKKQVFIDKADVVFKYLSDKDIKWYLSTEESIGAAGAYRLQKNGYKLVDYIDGDWTTVVGLPLRALIQRSSS